MDQNEITNIIETNPKLSHEEMRKQALEAGITREDFEKCWQKIEKNKERKWLMFIGLSFATIMLPGLLSSFQKSGEITIISLLANPFFTFLPVIIFYALIVFGGFALRIIACTFLCICAFLLYFLAAIAS